MSALFCKKHPDYTVSRKPSNDSCATCVRMWSRRHARRQCLNPQCRRWFCWEVNQRTRCCSVACANVMKAGVPADTVAEDRARIAAKDAHEALKKKYNEALKTIDRLETETAILAKIRAGISTTAKIRPHLGSGTSEAVPILVASDWHSEEIVKPASVSGLNEFNLEIFEKRSTRFFQAGLNLIKNHLNAGVAIHRVVLALLGDFITNDIHDAENAEGNALLPVDAIINAQNKIVAGIEFLLNHSKYDFTVICKVGNHSRTTKKVRSASEVGHSLETLMYVFLATHFRHEKRVQFVIDDGYHTFVEVYDRTIRFHHGHAIQYQGGIGGLFIPAYKAVSQWNKARPADLDVFGHFHQTKDGGSFLCNGSLIGYNAFAVRIKADYEPPQQTLFLIDKKRGRTCRWPVLV